MEMTNTLHSGMCRCCASEGTFKDIKTKYHWMGEEEVYADMLSDCFDIKVSYYRPRYIILCHEFKNRDLVLRSSICTIPVIARGFKYCEFWTRSINFQFILVIWCFYEIKLVVKC